jgi:hypothetical protein
MFKWRQKHTTGYDREIRPDKPLRRLGMKNMTRFICIAGILAVISTACGAKIKSPLTSIKTGPTQTVDIHVPMLESSSNGVELNLEFAAGELKLAPGNSQYLASGSATFNVIDLAPTIGRQGSSYQIQAGNIDAEEISTCPDNIENVWDLQLANTPMTLNIKAGAYDGSVELGGLSLKQLVISDEGSVFTGRFSEPNNVEMTSFTYRTGAGNTELKGLANANFSQMTFTSGPGEYTLGFDGRLQRNASVTIESRLSTVNIIVPKGVTVQVSSEGKLATVNPDSGWNQNGSVYEVRGSGPTITILVKMSTGTLNLKTE